jgi:hypothetical protein
MVANHNGWKDTRVRRIISLRKANPREIAILILTKQWGFVGTNLFVHRPKGRKTSLIHKQLYE